MLSCKTLVKNHNQLLNVVSQKRLNNGPTLSASNLKRRFRQNNPRCRNNLQISPAVPVEIPSQIFISPKLKLLQYDSNFYSIIKINPLKNSLNTNDAAVRLLPCIYFSTILRATYS